MELVWGVILLWTDDFAVESFFLYSQASIYFFLVSLMFFFKVTKENYLKLSLVILANEKLWLHLTSLSVNIICFYFLNIGNL
jgi:hypothetical protein